MKKTNSKYCLVITTSEKEEEAYSIANALVDSNLASCVQIDSINSIYKWNEKVQKTKEYRLFVKSVTSNFNEIEKTINQMHSYSTPQIISLNIDDGSAEYLGYLASSLLNKI